MRRFSVYEVLNHVRKEIFVGITERPLLEVVEAFSCALPAEIAHWSREEPVSIRGLSDLMPAADAWQFTGVYVSYIERDGWTIVRQRPEA